MKNDLLDILTRERGEHDDQKLIDYILDKLSEAERSEFEERIGSSEILQDAVQGLQGVKDKKDLQVLVEQLKKNLHDQLQKKKLERERRKITEYPWIYIAIIVILVFCIVAFVVTRMFLLSR
jgi:type II secretory pathway component PulF